MEENFIMIQKQRICLRQRVLLQAFEDPLILLAGGLDRGNDFVELIPFIKGFKALIIFGETAQKA